MVKKALLFNPDECLGCFACEVACKQEHGLQAGEHWIRIFKEGPIKTGRKWALKFISRRCRHCGRPACQEACPVGAISKRSDGIVLFSEELCIGCKDCIEVCPFGAPQYNVEKDIVRACNLCVERIDRGLKPSCVHHCPTKALSFGDCNSYATPPRKREGEQSYIDRERMR